MNSHWLYNGEPFLEIPEDAYGFVYKITNTETGKKYIGRKQFVSRRRKPLTKKQKESGRTRKTVVKTESNWREYTGSNNLLNEDIKKNGKNIFLFEILVVCYTKGQMNFCEETLQHKFNAVWDENYYNDSAGSGKWMTVKLTNDIKNQLKNIDKKLG